MKDLKKKIKKVYYYHENTHLESLNDIYKKEMESLKKVNQLNGKKKKESKKLSILNSPIFSIP